MSVFEGLIASAPGYGAKMDNALFDLAQVQKDTMIDDNVGQADQPQWYESLTLRSWVRGISVRPQPTAGQAFLQFFGGDAPIGVDQLTNKSFPNRPANKEVEGYGALGSRMDKTPKQRGVPQTALPVMELRGINSVVPLANVGQWSLDVFDYICSLNANPNGGHTLIQ
jgi:hypothetical protein